MISKRDRQHLTDVLVFGDTACKLVSRGKDAYDSDEMLRLAAEAIHIRIGEAVSRLSDEIVANHPDIEFREMKGARDFVAHKYHRIDPDVLWESLSRDFPNEIAKIRRILGTY